ncbi:AMP-binding protein [Natrarchaeobaculum aegyptiacum]|uniref:AMP-binding protein n=1 Tax=Natrarchaeobaculum aegyptiacum TaxID=745377 RepID=UPI000A3D8665|nr:class I adenylate-forming enzyme family protein [Natrarchaeobaculum aegyptiacum]
MVNIVTKLQDTVMANQSATAIGGDEPVDFGTLWSQTDRFAGGLQDRGIVAGDAIALHLEDARAFLVAVFGALRTGCVPVAIPPGTDPNGVADVVDAVEARALVTDADRIMAVLNRAESVRVAVVVGREARMGVDLSTFLENDGMNSAGSRTGIDVVKQSDDDLALIAFVDRAHRIPSIDRPRVPSERLEGLCFDHEALAGAADVGRSIGSVESHLGLRPITCPLEFGVGALATILAGGRYEPIGPWDLERVRARCVTGDAARTILTREQADALDTLEDLPIACLVLESLSSVPAGRLVTEGARGESGVALDTDGVRRLYGDPATGIVHASGSVLEGEPADDGTVRPLPEVDVRSIDTDRGTEIAVATPAGATKCVRRDDGSEPRTEDDGSEPRTEDDGSELRTEDDGSELRTDADGTQIDTDGTRIDALDGRQWVRPGILGVSLEGAATEYSNDCNDSHTDRRFVWRSGVH